MEGISWECVPRQTVTDYRPFLTSSDGYGSRSKRKCVGSYLHSGYTWGAKCKHRALSAKSGVMRLHPPGTGRIVGRTKENGSRRGAYKSRRGNELETDWRLSFQTIYLSGSRSSPYP